MREIGYKKILLLAMFFFLYGCIEERIENLNADVLSINNRVLYGEFDAVIFSGSQGSFGDGKIQLGLKFFIDDKMYLEDILVYTSEFYELFDKNNNKFPICFKRTRESICTEETIMIKVNNRLVKLERRDIQ